MAYIFTLIAALATFLLIAPSYRDIGSTAAAGARAITQAPIVRDLRIGERLEELKTVIRDRSMKLLREQLHEAIDDQVR